MENSIIRSIFLLAISPLMVLDFALALATALCAFILPRKRRWIPILIGCAAVALSLSLVILPYYKLSSIYSLSGMGRPEMVADVTLHFMSAAFILPIYVLLTLLGLAYALFIKTSSRLMVAVAAWLVFIAIDVATYHGMDWLLSVSLADGRWEKEDQLVAVEKDAFLKAMEQAGAPLSGDEIHDLELYLPDAVYADIRRDDFFKIHPPASMFSALLTGQVSDAIDKNSAMLETLIIDTYKQTCIEEGQRLAKERLNQQTRDDEMK